MITKKKNVLQTSLLKTIHFNLLLSVAVVIIIIWKPLERTSKRKQNIQPSIRVDVCYCKICIYLSNYLPIHLSTPMCTHTHTHKRKKVLRNKILVVKNQMHSLKIIQSFIRWGLSIKDLFIVYILIVPTSILLNIRFYSFHI